MSSDGTTPRLGDFITLVSGSTPSKANPDFWGYGIPWVSAKDMKDFWISDSEDHITPAGVAAASRIVKPGTVLLLTRGMTLHKRVPICRVALPSAFNQDVKAVLPKNGLSARFLPYLLTGNHDRLLAQVDSAGHGTGRLNTEAILSFPVRIPAWDEQEEIADIGETLDDRITLLRKTNVTLEAIAQALFKSWFVDFDPVRTKMEGRTLEGMDEATAALFPDGFEMSELGEVPRGWEVKSLDSIATYLNELALQKFPPTGTDDLPVIKIAQLRKGSTAGADLASRAVKPEYVVRNGDVLFSWSGTLEVEIWCGGEGALNQHLFKVASTKYPKWFYYLWTQRHLENFRLIAASKATTMGHIQRSHLSAAKVAVASDAVMVAADSVLGALIEHVIATALQAHTLATLRDTLLPRLISGQLRLPDAEEAVADALA